MLGVSSSLRHICALALPTKVPYFNYDVMKEGLWNLLFVLGVFLSGIFSSYFLHNPNPTLLAESTKTDLRALGITNFEGFMPIELFGSDQIFTLNGLIFMVIGGFLVGFGVRYANGCTSGHGLMGLAQGSIGSLAAVIAFFIGGMTMTYLIFPLIF